jgi:hypothetical protein
LNYFVFQADYPDLLLDNPRNFTEYSLRQYKVIMCFSREFVILFNLKITLKRTEGIVMNRTIMWRVFVVILFCTFLTNAQPTLSWTESSSNPVFGQLNGGPKAYYPSVLYDWRGFSGHGIRANYKMWYGTSDSKVGFAYSDDGTNWTDLGIVEGNVSYHCKVVYDPNGFMNKGKRIPKKKEPVYYKMWYANPDVWPYTHETIRYAESADGVNWVNDQPISQDPSYPLITGEFNWWYGTYGPGTVIYNSNGYTNWHNKNPLGHKYVMYYDVAPQNCIDGETEATALAYSLDGIYWRRYGDSPVILSGADDSWDAYYVYAWTVLKEQKGYSMWYSGGTEASHEGIGYAYSQDGINWIKDENNPIFSSNDGIEWRTCRTYNPVVLINGNIYKMWFSGVNDSGAYSIGYAAATPQARKVNRNTKPKNKPNIPPTANPTGLANSYQVFQNYPNPFNPTTRIDYILPEAAQITLTIYNLRGEEVLVLVNDTQSAGKYSVTWDATGFANGVYIYRLTTKGLTGKKVNNSYADYKKMLLIH